MNNIKKGSGQMMEDNQGNKINVELMAKCLETYYKYRANSIDKSGFKDYVKNFNNVEYNSTFGCDAVQTALNINFIKGLKIALYIRENEHILKGLDLTHCEYGQIQMNDPRGSHFFKFLKEIRILKPMSRSGLNAIVDGAIIAESDKTTDLLKAVLYHYEELRQVGDLIDPG